MSLAAGCRGFEGWRREQGRLDLQLWLIGGDECERRGRTLPQVGRGEPDAGTVASRGFEQSLILFGERCRLRRKDFQHADEVVVVEDGNDEHGTNAEAARDGGVDARVGFSVGAKLGLAGVETRAGEAILGVEGNAEIGGVESGGGAANHLVAAHKRQSGGASAGGSDGAHDQFIQDEIESEFGRKAGLNLLLDNAVQIGPGGKNCIHWFGLGPRHG